MKLSFDQKRKAKSVLPKPVNKILQVRAKRQTDKLLKGN